MNEFWNVKRLKDETDFEFCLRVCMAKANKEIDADWGEIVEAFNLGVHSDTLRKNFVGPMGVKHIVDYYDEKLLKQIQDGKSQSEKDLDNKIHQLYMEKQKLKDERSALNRKLRLQARWEELLVLIQEEISNTTQDKYLSYSKHIIEPEENNEAVLVISDTHIGMTVDNELNKYNKEICIERFHKLIDSTLKNCKRNGVTTLNIALLGDIVEGVINLTGRLEQNEDVVQQVFTGYEIITEVIVELSKHIKQINVWSTNGNHARLSKDVKECLDGESFESLLYEYIKLKIESLSHVIDLSNVTLHDNRYPDLAIIHIDNCNKTIAASHGTKDKKVATNVSRINGFLPIQIDYYMMGHLHNSHHQNNCYVNGCLSGSNSWAQGQRYNNDPMQIMLVFFADGSTNLCEMVLK